MNPRILVASLVLLGAPALAVAYFTLTPLSLPGVEAAPGSCAPAPAPQAPPHLRWNDATLELAVEHTANCAASLQGASVQRLGTHLFVRTRYAMPEDMATGCTCRHRTDLRIAGLPRQDYRVHAYAWP